MKKILFVYPSMILGGSTTALLSLLNGFDPQKYSVDLQLFRNKGVLLGELPPHVNLLPPAERYCGKKGKIIKSIKFLLTGYFFRAVLASLKHKKIGLDGAATAKFQAKYLSRRSSKQYDCAIGFLEGWSDWYLGFGVEAVKKYAWLHSTYANITPYPESELPWMQRVDKVVFVTEACREDFARALPQMADKATVVENLIDSGVIRRRAEQVDPADEAYLRFRQFDGFKLITVCRLTMQVKGLDRIVDCAKRLKAAGKRFLWYIVGDGHDELALRSLIADRGIEDCLVSIGKRLNPYPLIKAADVMCMPSRYEGKPMVVTESMILGTPPLVTEYLSAHSQIENGKEGIVVPNNDTAIYDAVLACLEDGVKTAEMRKALQSKEYGNKEYFSKMEKELFA